MEEKQLTDRIYFRANFSTSTTPESSGGQQKDDDDNVIAEIPLQLPTNTIDIHHPIKNIEMMLTKLQIPLSCIPVNNTPVDAVIMLDTDHELNLLSKGIIRIWPFWLSTKGTVEPTEWDANPIFVDGDQIPVEHCILPAQRPATLSMPYREYVRQLAVHEEYYFKDINNLLAFINAGIAQAFKDCVKMTSIPMIGGSTSTLRYSFSVENDSIKLTYNNFGSPYIVVPCTEAISSRDGNSSWGVDSNTNRCMYKVCKKDGEIESFNAPEIVNFSIIVNKYIRDLLPCLPWIKVDNRDLEHWRPSGGTHTEVHPGYIPDWEAYNYEDPYFYVLDTFDAPVDFHNDDVQLFDEHQTNHILTTSMDYRFPSVDVLSLINISSFIVTFDGVSMIQQNFPVNITNVANKSASLATSIPIIEVYYPIWNSVRDISGDMIISKDAFTNAAPILLGPDSLRERNLKFKLHYVTNDGTLHAVKLLPSKQVSLQICYSIRYV